MAEATTENLAVRIRGALRDTSAPLWFPQLTADLGAAAWRNLHRSLRLTSASYSTSRILRQDPDGIRRIVISIDGRSRDPEECKAVPVELLPDDLARRYSGPEMRFFEVEEIVDADVSVRVGEALEVLGAVPTVLPTVCSLVRALHLIDTEDDEVDVSFSDPALPFSAFISVPGQSVVAGALRIAEGLLHEAMHLQLSLIEGIVPLVTAKERTYFSPWRNEYRTAQGVLHALYVFRVIDAFVGAVSFPGPELAHLQSYATKRRATIAQQVNKIRDFRGCADLSADGVAFVDRLLG